MKVCSLIVIFLLFTTIGIGEIIGQLPGVLKPGMIKVDEHGLCITDDYAIHFFSLNPFKLNKKFGKKGEGPGEFKYRPRVQLLPNQILAVSGDYCVWFSRDGKMIKDGRTSGTVYYPILVKEKFVAYKAGFDQKEGQMIKIMVLLDSQLKEVKELHKGLGDSNYIGPNDPATKEYKMLLHFTRYDAYGDKIFVANSRKGFYFEVFDLEGNHIYTIDKNDEIDKVPVDNNYKKKARNFIKESNRNLWERKTPSSFTFYEYFPPIREFLLDDGKLYVFTYKEKDNKNEIIILDLKGKIIKRIFAPVPSMRIRKNAESFDPFTIYKGVLYQLIENDETEIFELHKTALE